MPPKISASNDADSNFVRLINRWRLEKATPHAKLSPPKKQIVWYVEDTVPIEYRPYVEEGIREWNKAFEKIGFKDAIAVRWEESGRDDFDPEDTQLLHVPLDHRRTTSYAMSCLRANPLTGEMIDGDVVFDASFIRYWKQEYALLIGSTTATTAAADRPAGHRRGDQPDPGLEDGLSGSPTCDSPAGRRTHSTRTPTRWSPRSFRPIRTSWRGNWPRTCARGSRGFCQYQSGLQRDFGLAAIAMADGAPNILPSHAADKDKGQRKTKSIKADKKKPAAQGRAARRVHRPGDQGDRDARGRPLAGPAAQLQGQHDADGRPAQRHRDHPQPRAWSAA